METLKEIIEKLGLKQESVISFDYDDIDFIDREVTLTKIKGTGGYNFLYVSKYIKDKDDDIVHLLKVQDGKGESVYNSYMSSNDACKRFIEIFNLWEDKEKIDIGDYCNFVSVVCELDYDEVEFEHKKRDKIKFRFHVSDFTFDVFFYYHGDILDTSNLTEDGGDYYSFGKVNLYEYDIFVIESSGNMYHVLSSIVKYIV